MSIDLDTCPKCKGVADNGHDRCYPPNPYYCTKCCAEIDDENTVMGDAAGLISVERTSPASMEEVETQSGNSALRSSATGSKDDNLASSAPISVETVGKVRTAIFSRDRLGSNGEMIERYTALAGAAIQALLASGEVVLRGEVVKLHHEQDSTRGLWCIDQDPKEVTHEWIKQNAFQLE